MRNKLVMVKKIQLIFVMVVLFPGQFYGQVSDTVLITGNYSNTSMIDFLNEIETGYSIDFYYNPEWFNNLTVNQTFLNTPVENVMDRILKETPYHYITFQNAYIFLPREDVYSISYKLNIPASNVNNNSILIGNANETGRYKSAEIKGHITGGNNKDPLAGTTLQMLNTRYAVISNKDGYYSFILATGEYNLKVSCIGYESAEYKIKVVSNGIFDIELFEKSVKLDEVIISSRKPDHNVTGNQMSLIEMNRKTIQLLPFTIGTKDILKSMTLMPGIKSVGEFGSDINVRGGGNDQNLILIEGTPVFNTAHVFGLLSVINADAIESAMLYKGDIPAKFGERVSSVMDLKVRQDNDEKFRANGGIGLLDSRITLGIPVIKKKLSILVGGRTTYSDFLLRKMPDPYLKNSSARFFDLCGMINYDFNKANQFSLFFYRSYDVFDYVNTLKYDYGNTLGSIRWSHSFNPRLFAVLNGGFSNYEINKFDESNEFEKSITTSTLNYKSGKLNFTYTLNPTDIIDLGVQSIYYNIQPGKLVPMDEISLISAFKLNKEYALENAFYLSGKFEVNKVVSINAGIRFSSYAYLGPNKLYQYKPESPRLPYSIVDSVLYKNNKIINSNFRIEPRISFRFQLNSTSSIKLNYNRSDQYISSISYSSITTPDDRWKLSDPFIKPILCDQIALGYYRNFKHNSIETSLEFYYKKLQNLVEYKNGAKISLNPYLETVVLNASEVNYGIEFYLKKNLGVFEGWIGYTYSRSLKKTSGKYADEIVNNNTWYPSSYDIPHDLTLMVTYHLNRRWKIAGTFKYNSGRSITLPELKYLIDGEWVIQFSERNKYRLPDYHRLDLSISRDESLRIKKKWKGSWTFSVINVYGRNNAYSIFYAKQRMSAENDYRLFSLYKLYIIGQPIPTLTYNFIF